MTYHVLVTGSRFWTDRGQLYAVLDDIRRQHGDLVIVHGGNWRGADRMAVDWVVRAHRQAHMGGRVRHEPHKARWELLGKAAGNARNQAMADAGADECVAFFKDGARNAGTSDCAERAENAGIPVRKFHG